MSDIPSGKLIAAIGSSRSGKTQYVREQLEGQRRVLIWDVKGEYKTPNRARTKRELAQMVASAMGKPGIIAYTGNLHDFEYFCKLAQTWVKRQCQAGHNCILVFEETADVTTPAKAPPEYGIILRRYLSYGVTIFAITQSPEESDKTSIRNASVLHVCRLNTDPGRKSIAKNTGLPLPVIESLEAVQDEEVSSNARFDYLHADTGKRVWHKGQLTFSRGGGRVFTKVSEEMGL